MKLRRCLAGACIAAILISTFASCGGDSKEPTNSGSSSSTPSVTDSAEMEKMRNEILKDVTFEEREAEKDSYDFGGKTVIIGSPWIHELFLEPGTTEAGDKWLARVKEVEDKYNVKIKTVSTEYGYFCDQLMTAAQANTKFADIIELDSRWLAILGYPGYIKPLNKVKTGINIKDAKWHPTQLRASKQNKNIYGVKKDPVEMQNVVFWNKTLFSEQGLPDLYELVEKKEWTWDKMKEIAVQATKDSDNDGTPDQWGFGGCETERSFILSNGGSIMKETADGKMEFTMNNPATIEGLDFLQDLMYKTKCMEVVDVNADWRYQCDPQFMNRVYAMVSFPFYGADVWFQYMEDDWGVVPFPIGPKMDDYIIPAEYNRNWALTNNNPDEEMASVVMDALFSPYADETADSWKDRYTEVLRDEESMNIIEQLLAGDHFVLDITGYFPKVGTSSDIIGWYKSANNCIYYNVYTNRKTPAAAIAEKQDQAKTLIDDFFKDIKLQ